MTEITFGNKPVRFRHISGTVVSSSTRSETHVSSSGGGGYVGQSGGYVSAARIHSNVKTIQEFWVRTADGVEHSLRFTNMGIALREGQEISLLVAERGTDSKNGWYVEIVNHNAKTRTTITPIYPLLTRLDLKGDDFITFLKFVALAGGCYAWIAFESKTAGLATLGALLYFSYRRWMRITLVERKLRDCINQHANALLSTRGNRLAESVPG